MWNVCINNYYDEIYESYNEEQIQQQFTFPKSKRNFDQLGVRSLANASRARQFNP